MKYTVTETPNKENEKRKFNSGVYNLSGVQRETVESFWEYLKAHEDIAGYEIEEKK